MSPKYLLDTNICIYIAKQKPLAVFRKFSDMPAGSLAMSTISYGELMFAAEKSQHSHKALSLLEEFIKYIPSLPLPVDAANCYGEIRHFLEKQGQPIGNNDLWIAAHAVAGRFILVSNNEKEFARVPRLSVENWVGVGL